VTEIAKEFRERKIPCDVIWMDIHYMNGYRIFTFCPKEFPNPKKLNEQLHSLGYRSVWMIDPGVKKEDGEVTYDSGAREDHWVLNPDLSPYQGHVWPGLCAFPDYTMEKTREWWGDLYKNFLTKELMGCGMI
jgi:alpha-glucosidase